MEDKSISREWPGSQNGQGVGKLPASVRSWLLSYRAAIDGPCFADLQPYVFTRVRVVGGRFFEIGKRQTFVLDGAGKFKSTHSSQ